VRSGVPYADVGPKAPGRSGGVRSGVPYADVGPQAALVVGCGRGHQGRAGQHPSVVDFPHIWRKIDHAGPPRSPRLPRGPAPTGRSATPARHPPRRSGLSPERRLTRRRATTALRHVSGVRADRCAAKEFKARSRIRRRSPRRLAQGAIT
jgi:hypothetical protein